MDREKYNKIKEKWVEQNKKIMPICFDKGNNICDDCGFVFCDKCKEKPKDNINYLNGFY